MSPVKLLEVAVQMPCLFHLLTGLYCPGCGGTRAVKYLLRGQITESFVYHPLVPFAAVAVTAELVSWLAARYFKKPGLCLGHERLLIGIAVAVTAVNWVVKNVLLIGFGIDLLAAPL